MKNKGFIGNRWFYLLCCLGIFIIEALIAMYVHDTIIRPYIGDILVVVLVYCFVRIFISRPLRWLPLWVFLFACCIEFMQYFQLADILGLRHNSVARIILGSVFDWKDIACYALGCLPLFLIKR